jgi:predicted MFS family arabinose efflux permease
VLALPELYGRFHTTIEGVSWVVTSYNLAVAVVALALVPAAGRIAPPHLLAAGIAIFVAASIACALAGSLPVLIAARTVQGTGAALLLAGTLPVLGSATWTFAGTFGAALGPALGGAVTQAFDWRAIFAVQAPVAAAGLVALRRDHPDRELPAANQVRAALPANICVGLLFGALVGVLFLAVLLVIEVWGYTPLGGAAVVSAIPAATLTVRRLHPALTARAAVTGGAALVALGLVALALLPSPTVWYVVAALAFCGAGVGLVVPSLSAQATRNGPLTIGVRHLGLVLALAVIAPLLAHDLPAAGQRAALRATAVLLDAPVPATKKVPVALAAAKEFEQARDGEVPNLAEPFDEHGARTDPQLRAARDRLVTVVDETITRGFRRSFIFSALLAATAGVLALLLGRRAGA